MQYDATITGVNSKTVNRKSDGKTITLFEVQDSTNRTWATARRDLANEAHRLLNQMATITGTVQQNGTYENFYLDDVQPINQLNQSFQQQQAQAQPPQPVQQATQAPRITAEGEGTAKDWTVWRQTATKVAAHTSTTPQEFWANVGQLITFYATGLMPELGGNGVREPRNPTPNPQDSGVTSYAPADGARQAQANQYIPEDAGPFDPTSFPEDDSIPF